MKTNWKYLLLLGLSIIVSQVGTLLFLILRFLSDQVGITKNVSIVFAATPILISLLTAIVIYFIADKMKVDKQKEIAAVVFIIWFVLFVIF